MSTRNGVEDILNKANGSIAHVLITSGLLVTVVTGIVFGSIWIGKLDQRVADLEKESGTAVTLAQQVASADGAHMQQFVIVEERQNQVLKHLDNIEQHLSAVDERITQLELVTAVSNRGEPMRRPRPQ